MNGLCHESRPVNSRKVQNTPITVRSNTSSGTFGSVYVVEPDGSARLWERCTRWEPRALVRSRAAAALGVRKEAA
jgi:hypothetical protein